MITLKEFYRFSTTMGPMIIVGDEWGLTHLFFEKNTQHKLNLKEFQSNAQRFKGEVEYLRDYLSGSLQAEHHFTWTMGNTGTPFQKRVWNQMKKVKFGLTRSYGEIAQSLGSKNYSRAVGGACHANPILIFIPCHRITASGGGLGGFALGPIVKQKLLQLEQRET